MELSFEVLNEADFFGGRRNEHTGEKEKENAGTDISRKGSEKGREGTHSQKWQNMAECRNYQMVRLVRIRG